GSRHPKSCDRISETGLGHLLRVPAFERVSRRDADPGPAQRNRHQYSAPQKGCCTRAAKRSAARSVLYRRQPVGQVGGRDPRRGEQLASPIHREARAQFKGHGSGRGRHCGKCGMDRRRVALRRRSRCRKRYLSRPTTQGIYESENGGIMISLAGKAALITGGSRGIGAAAVKLFAQAGADVVFSYNSAKEAAKQLEQEAAKHGTRVEAFKADAGKHADNKKLVEHAITRLGRLDILVANAGVWNMEDLPIENMTEKQWDDMMRINLKSVYSVIHFAVPQMIKQKS